MFNPYFFYHNNQNDTGNSHSCEPISSSNTKAYNDDFIYQNVMTSINSHQQILK